MDGSIQHVYFFCDNDNNNTSSNTTSKDNKRKDSATTSPVISASAYEVPPFDPKERAAMSKRTAATRGASESSSGSSSNNSRSSSGTLSATAPTFVPAPRPTSNINLFQVGAAPGKGLGIFATKFIKRGTRIICEEPLLRIDRNEPHLAWEKYQKLSPEKRQDYDQLHRYSRAHLDLEAEARQRLPGSNDKATLARQVAVMERFGANNFFIYGGNHAVFLLSSRLNHSCEPNVFQSFNPTLGMKTVHAMRDIQAGEELVTNYLGRECHYMVRTQRWEMFRTQWGFTCDCAACSDRTGHSDARHSILANLFMGLQDFDQGNMASQNPFMPANTAHALDTARDILTLCLEQKMYGIELCTAHRAISAYALDLQDFHTAWEAAKNEEEVERNIMGTETEDLKAKGAGSALWIAHVWKVMKKAGYHPDVRSKKKTGKKHKNRKENWQNKQKMDKANKKGSVAPRDEVVCDMSWPASGSR